MFKPLLCMSMMAVCMAGTAIAADSLSNMLSVARIVSQSDGNEHSEPANSAKPGDVLEYTALYRNAGAGAVRKLEVTLPIPEGTEYLAGQAHPAGAWASIDGKTFAPQPLHRRVAKADGAMVDELVPLQEYRFLRWPPADLAAGASLECRARVKITTRVTESSTRP